MPSKRRSRSYSRSSSYSSTSRSRSRSYYSSSYYSSRSRSLSPIRPEYKLVLTNITRNVTREHLAEIFGVYGEVEFVDVPMNKALKCNKEMAYIIYRHKSDALDAIEHMNKAQIDGNTVQLRFVKQRK